jgi:nucleoside 2-deoxyribosyltransferase
MYKNKVYLSGGFKSNWQKKVIDACGNNFIFFNPGAHNLPEPAQYFAWDVHYVKQCDIVFAYMEERNPSGYGLAFELGIAHTIHKTIILIDERSEVDDTFERYFKIIHSCANVSFNDLEDGIEYLNSFVIK